MNTKEFDRNIWCLLGLPFDAVSLGDAVDRVHLASLSNTRLFLSTPNLNFLITSQSDPDFRFSVINSELSIIDGMPLVWIAKLLGYPIKERVAGSDLFEKLRQKKTRKKLNIFFFGGPEGMAEKACKRLKINSNGVTCSGFHSPGFGSIEKMSTSEILNKINDSKPDFLLVALGAKKGQAWIEYNLKKLNTPVISHLGAVVNFVAGDVKRAPVFFQKMGIEWVWRILQEPALWKRYFNDGWQFIKLMSFCVFPYVVWKRYNKKLMVNEPVSYNLVNSSDHILIKINGSCILGNINPLRKVFEELSSEGNSITLDLSRVPVIDGAFLGLSLVFYKHLLSRGGSLNFIGLDKNVRRIFKWNCTEFLL